MPVCLEFIDLIAPIETIRRKYPGGWEQCVKDNEGPRMWHDRYLARVDGAMNPTDMESIAGKWEKTGFQMTEEKNGRRVWKDFCVTGSDVPCDWLEIHPEKFCAYLKGTDPDGLAYGPLEPEHLLCVGAMIGDIAGSGYEWNNIKRKPDRLIRGRDYFTDDTVLTYAVALGIIDGMKKIDRSVWMNDEAMQGTVETEIARSLKHYARIYPNAGYGGAFKRWMLEEGMERRDSWGNGSAMRASFAGWYADSLEEAKLLGKLSASFTHGHPEGIEGAVAVAGCIWLLRNGGGKEEAGEYAGKFYDLNFRLDDIRAAYDFDVSCAGSVPPAIVAFLEEDSFEETIRAAISIGGDSDTLAAIAGSIAEAHYPVPGCLKGGAWAKLDSGMKFAAITASETLRQLRPENFDPDKDMR